MRLARAAGGGVDYWIGLPVSELVLYLIELSDQITEDREAAQQDAARRG